MRALRSTDPTAALEFDRAAAPHAHSSPGEALELGKGRKAGNEEPERKKRQAPGSILSPPLKKQNSAVMAEDKKTDPAVLQFQNQKLSQQLELQKELIQDVETKLDGLHKKQAEYDANLIAVNRVWGQLLDDLGIMAVKATSSLNGTNGISSLRENSGVEAASTSEASSNDVFLTRLLDSCPRLESDEEPSTSQQLLEKALEAKSTQTVKILKGVIGGIEQQRRRNEDLSSCLRQSLSEKDVIQSLERNEVVLREEVAQTRVAMDEIHVKHRALSGEVSLLRDVRLKQQSEIKALSEQLEETQIQLDAAKRRLASMRQQKEASASAPGSCPTTPMSKSESIGNGLELKAQSDEMAGLKAALDVAEALAGKRLKEIEAKHKEHLELMQRLRLLEATLKDEQHIKSSWAYTLLQGQLTSARSDMERLQGTVEQLQRERNMQVVREKDMAYRADAGDGARRACVVAESRIQDLEGKLRVCAEERDTLQQRLEHLQNSTARTDTVDELKVMVATLHKELALLQDQVRKYKELAQEVPATRAANKSLEDILLRKAADCDEMSKRCEATADLLKQQDSEIKALRGTELELRLYIDMYARESTERRDMRDVKQAEVRALAQVEQLKAELDEHGLALRVKAANEAEAACQQRLAAAESEISRLRDQVAAAERRAVELEETVKARAEEGDVYMTEIETIGQAYEEMQSQNRRLLQQITERDEYNTQLMGESVKAKQLQGALTAEKEAMEARMQHVAAMADVDKQRVAQLDDKMKGSLEQLRAALEEKRQVQAELEAARKHQAEAEREAEALRQSMEAARKELEDRGRGVQEAEEQLIEERFKRTRAEEEKEALAQKLGRANKQRDKGSSIQVELLHEELAEYKSILKCSVCHDRRKEVAITKCFHLFCSPCIQRNLELRHRKCPGCGVPFGQGDVRQVYL